MNCYFLGHTPLYELFFISYEMAILEIQSSCDRSQPSWSSGTAFFYIEQTSQTQTDDFACEASNNAKNI